MIKDSQALKNIAANLRFLLKDRGLSQRDLAKITGDPVMTINSIATGRHLSRSGILARIAKAFGLTVDDFLSPPPKKVAKSA